MDNHNHQEFLGVDVGAARVGIARGNTAARLSEALTTVPAGQAVAELLELSDKNQVFGIVVGLPRSLDGSETDQTKAVRQWVQSASAQIKLPFYWQDEALTSQRAELLKPKAKSPGTDAEAAAIILQDFLDSTERDRVTA